MIERKLKEIDYIRQEYTQQISRSRWVRQYDNDYHKRQVAKLEEKLNNPDKYYKCSCGEMLCYNDDGSRSQIDFFKSRGGRDHIKTAKHCSAIMRIDYDKKGFDKKKNFPISLMLFLNNHINFKIHNHKGDGMNDKLRRIPKKSKKKNPVFYTIQQAIIRYKILNIPQVGAGVGL